MSVAPAAVRFDFPVMLLAAVVCIPVFLTHRRVSRLEGAALLAGYAAYVAYVVLEATSSIGPAEA